ncbi:keywimysin-related RiPP [Streptomyces sp. XD-27]|nr:keywimysin-related RiPP [Streptomyces sp. XD-27]WKX73389.1 keywimysin-related RiPP [Streptomyces sp. XD-27]
MRAYERPTLTAVGTFTKATGLFLFKRRGPKDFLGRNHALFT